MDQPCAATLNAPAELEDVRISKRFFIKACAAVAGSIFVPDVAARGRQARRTTELVQRTLIKGQQSVASMRVLEQRRILATYAPGTGQKVTYGAGARIRQLAVYNTHTGESISAPYWANGAYRPSALRQFSILLRDHHNNEIHVIDPQLLDLLFQIQHLVGRNEPYHVMSGYRSPETNEILGRHRRGVAEHSMHLEGKAADLWLPGCSLNDLRRAAVQLGGGGVGYYPESNFVHIDTGKVRYWGS